MLYTVTQLSSEEEAFIELIRTKYPPPQAVGAQARSDHVSETHVLTGHEFDLLVAARKSPNPSQARARKLRALAIHSETDLMDSPGLPKGYGQAILATDKPRAYFEFSHFDAGAGATGSAAAASSIRWSQSLRRPPSDRLKAKALAQARTEQRQQLQALIDRRPEPSMGE